jgi:hypothetical protein
MTIDHCLVNRDFCVLDRKVERDIGSDHLPVFVRLALIGQEGNGKLPNIAGRDEIKGFGK